MILKKINKTRSDMKLQDYAQYYIGAPCLNTWFAPDHDAYDAGWKLTGFQSTSVRPFGLENETDKTWTESIMPLLRRLEDMTEEEAIAIATMAMFDKSLGYPVSDYTVRRQPMGNYPPSACRVAINNDWYDMEIAIGFNSGNIWYTKGEQRVFNQPAIFHTLLQYHFDLFGLIPANLAIDIKTL